MLFHSLDYLVFLPLTALLFWGLPREHRLVVLGLASLIFYGSWNPAYLPVMILVITVGWLGGQWIAAWRNYTGTSVRQVVVMGLLLLPLLFFKYWDWIADNLDAVTELAGLSAVLPRVGLVLPVGISFFSFQALAYVIDVGRKARQGEDAAEHDLWRFTTFQTFFPQLVAGPIVRRHQLLPQLTKLPPLSRDQIGAGVYRIARGFTKKVLIADVMRVSMVDPVFADPSRFTGLELLVALYAYTLQIYYDFSGYTDIAIGSARLFGIELPENFDRPYKATTVAGFWRRWHITLSNWVRDYIYFPLGGARVDREWKIYRNLMATMLIIGIWHGASWNFVVYGLLHGTATSINRYFRKRDGTGLGDPLPNWWAYLWRWFLTFHFVVLARILFRAEDLGKAWSLAMGLFDTAFVMPRFAPLAWGVLFLGYAVHFTPSGWSDDTEAWFERQQPIVWAVVCALVGAAVFQMGTGEHLAFVYYQF